MSVGLWFNGAFQNHLELLISYFFNCATEALDDVVVFDKFKKRSFRDQLSVTPVRVNIAYEGSWKQRLEDNIAFLEYNDIDTLIVFKTDLRSNFRYGNEQWGRTIVKGTKKNDQYGQTFSTTKATLENLLVVEAASICCDNVYQYALDPDEARLETVFNFKNFKRMFFNDNDRQGAYFVPYYERMLAREYYGLNVDKVNDFCFHATANNDSRKYLQEQKHFLEDHPGFDCHVKCVGERGTSTQREYMGVLQRSRFTMVVPAYDPTTFSWPRFFEAAACGCLPFVLNGCNLQDIRNIFPDVCDIIESELMLDSIGSIDKRIKNFGEDKRKRILHDIMESRSIKQVTDKEWVEEKWRSFKGLGGTA